MKKLLAVIIAVMLCASACAPKETAMDPVTPGTEGGQTASTEADDTGEFISEEDGRNINAMLPIMDSIVRSIGIDSDTKYDAKSEDLIWSVLYLTGVNWGMSIEPETAEPTVTTDEQGYVTVPASTMELCCRCLWRRPQYSPDSRFLRRVRDLHRFCKGLQTRPLRYGRYNSQDR